VNKNIQNSIAFFGIIFLLIFTSCDSKDANDCIQASGTVVKEERPVTPFSKILVNEGVSMIIKQGDVYKVEIESGENLLNDIKVEVVDNQLILTDTNVCNYVREYDNTNIYVTAPTISEIRSATQREIYSDGVIEGERLVVYSENYQNNEYLTSANIYLDVNVTSFQIIFNGISNIFIDGTATNLNVNMASGNGRFEGRNFSVENATIYHRSSNDVIVKASKSLKGDIYSTGDVISVGTPESVQVNEHYKGKLIYED